MIRLPKIRAGPLVALWSTLFLILARFLYVTRSYDCSHLLKLGDCVPCAACPVQGTIDLPPAVAVAPLAKSMTIRMPRLHAVTFSTHREGRLLCQTLKSALANGFELTLLAWGRRLRGHESKMAKVFAMQNFHSP